MVFDGNGRLVMVAGSVGGSQIINDVAQALWLILAKGWRPQAAAELHHFGSRNGPTELEMGADPAWQTGLEALGHKVQSLEMTSGLHIVLRTGNGWLSGIDPRREGAALGR
jgi:gamma-glutamyltranspeptidase/glutathione hydrolase